MKNVNKKKAVSGSPKKTTVKQAIVKWFKNLKTIKVEIKVGGSAPWAVVFMIAFVVFVPIDLEKLQAIVNILKPLFT